MYHLEIKKDILVYTILSKRNYVDSLHALLSAYNLSKDFSSKFSAQYNSLAADAMVDKISILVNKIEENRNTIAELEEELRYVEDTLSHKNNIMTAGKETMKA